MDNPRKHYYKVKADTIIKNLKKRQIEGLYFENKEAALESILSMLKEGSTIFWGGSTTVQKDLGLYEILGNKNFTLIDCTKSETPEEEKKKYRQAFSSDYYFMSSNAITKDGEIINIDGRGNRVAALCYGPDKVFIVIGMNKVVNDVEEGIKRIRNTATPMNAYRLDFTPPCSFDGNCHDCIGKNTLCCQILITRNSFLPNRITVILIGETLGF